MSTRFLKKAALLGQLPLTLSVYGAMVTSLNNDPTEMGTLPYQILQAASGDTITFDSSLSGPINLNPFTVPPFSSGSPSDGGSLPAIVQDSLTIQGNGTVSIDGNGHRSQAFSVAKGTLTLQNLTINRAVSNGGSGGSGSTGGGGAVGGGGALYVHTGATATISNVTFTNNRANGGAGGSGLIVGAGAGGGGGGYGGGDGGAGTSQGHGGGGGGHSGGGAGLDGDTTTNGSTNNGIYYGGGGGGGSQGQGGSTGIFLNSANYTYTGGLPYLLSPPAIGGGGGGGGGAGGNGEDAETSAFSGGYGGIGIGIDMQFGGGGGGGANADSFDSGGPGTGAGGGGGHGGAGGLGDPVSGGGGGGGAGAGSFGSGSGGGGGTGVLGGVYGGQGGSGGDPGGGGGAALGGAIFVREEAVLNINDGVSFSGSGITPGTGGVSMGSMGGTPPTAGQAYGLDVFLCGGSTSAGTMGAILNCNIMGDLSVSLDGQPNVLRGSVAGTINKSGSGTLTLISPASGSMQFNGSINVTGGTVIFEQLAMGTFAGTVSGTGAIQVNTDITFSGTTTGFTGTTVIVGAGVISTPFPNSTDYTIQGGSTWSLTGNKAISSLTGTGTVDLGSSQLTIQNSTNDTFDGVLTGMGTLIKNSTGTLYLSGISGPNTYTGGTTIAGGVLQIGSATGLSTGNVTDDASLVFTAGATGANITQVISGSGSLTVQGGTITLSGSNSYTGVTTVDGGTLALSSGGAIASSSEVNLASGATFNISATTAGATIQNLVGVTGSIVTLGGRTLTDTVTGSTTFNGVINGTGGFVKQGSGTLTLGSSNGYTGGTSFDGGTMQISNDNNLGGASGTLSFNSGTLELTSNVTTNRSVTLNSGGGIILVDSGDTGTFNGNIAGSGTLTKSGSGALVLAGTNTYGNTTISAGIVQINSSTGLPTNSNVTNDASLIFNNAGTATYSGVISGSGTLTMKGSGTVDLSGNPGNSTYSGGTFFDAGTIKISTARNLGIGTTLTFNGGTLETASNLTLTQTAMLNSGGGTVQTDTGVAAIYTGRILGDGSLTKTGPGALTLGTLSSTGLMNSYSGGTRVSAGTLTGDTYSLPAGGGIVNNAALIFDQTFDDTYRGPISGTGTFEKTGSQTLSLSMNLSQSASTINLGTLNLVGITMSSPLTIALGGTLIGNGTVIGNVLNNGAISPGNSIGIINITGNLTSPGTLTMEIASDGSSDQILVSGTANFSGGTLDVMVISGSYTAGQTFDLVEAASIPVDFSTINLPSDLSLTHQILTGTPNIYQLVVTTNSVFVGQTALTRNTSAVQAYLKMISAPFQSIIQEVLVNFGGFTNQQLTNALDQLHPSPSGAFDLINLNMNHEIANILSEHLLQPDCHKRCAVEISDAQDQMKKSLQTSLWVTPFGVVTRNKNVGSDMVGFRSPAGGILIGGDYCFSKQYTFGGMLGYSQAFVDWQKSRGDAHIRNQIAGVYSGYRCHRMTVDAALFGGLNFYDITRNIKISILNRQAKSFHRGGNLASRLGANYRFNIHDFQIIPFASVESYYNYQEGYKEHSAKLLDLKVHTKVSNLLRSELGFDLKRLYNYSDGCWAPYIGVSYVRKSPLSSGKIRAGSRYFPGQFTVFTFSKAINQVSPTAGFVSSWGKNGSFSGVYRAEIGQGDTVHAFEMRLAGQF